MAKNKIPEFFVKKVRHKYYVARVQEGQPPQSTLLDIDAFKIWCKEYTYENFITHLKYSDEEGREAIRPLKIEWILRKEGKTSVCTRIKKTIRFLKTKLHGTRKE